MRVKRLELETGNCKLQTANWELKMSPPHSITTIVLNLFQIKLRIAKLPLRHMPNRFAIGRNHSAAYLFIIPDGRWPAVAQVGFAILAIVAVVGNEIDQAICLSKKKDLPHNDFDSYLTTDLEKFMFIMFYEMFVSQSPYSF